MQPPAASESDYYLRLGLASDPFSLDSMPEFFFVGAQRRFIAQRAVHALYISGSTVLLIGVDGAGKTRTLAEIAKELKDLADICRIEASVLMNAAEIRASLASALGLPASAATTNTEFVYALERIRPTNGDPQPVLIAIDAAQLLSIETLGECAALIAGAGGRLRLLLAGETDLRIAWQQAQTGAAEILELKPLDRSESEDYVRTRIQAAGSREEHLPGEAEFNRLYEQSGGNFAIIHSLMPQFLQPQPEAASIAHRVRQLPLLHIVAATAILAAVILSALYRGNSESSQPTDTAQAQTYDRTSGENAKDVASVALQLPASVPAATPTNSSPAAFEKPVAVVVPNATENESVEKSASRDRLTPQQKNTARKESPVKTEVKETVPKAETAPRAETVPKAKVEAVAPNKSGSLNEDARALLAMPSSQYVLQLIGAESKTTVEKFAKGAGKGLKLYVYQTQLRGRPWIIAVTGPYADKKAAQTGLEKLPAAVRKQQPWPRTLANVQADIRAHDGH